MDALGLYHTSQIADIHNKPKWQFTSKCRCKWQFTSKYKCKWQFTSKCKWQFTSESVSWQFPAIEKYLSAPSTDMDNQ